MLLDAENEIEIKYLSKDLEKKYFEKFNKEYREELEEFRSKLPYYLSDEFERILSFRTNAFCKLKDEIFKKGFLMGLMAKSPKK